MELSDIKYLTIMDNKFHFKMKLKVISFPFLKSNIPHYICYNTFFFSQLVRFADICSDISGFAERVPQIYCKLLHRNYEVKLLEKAFNQFLCHHSDTLLKYGPNIQDLLYVYLNFKTSNEHSVEDHCTTGNVTSSSTYITSRIPVPLINLGNACYLNSILQVLF